MASIFLLLLVLYIVFILALGRFVAADSGPSIERSLPRRRRAAPSRPPLALREAYRRYGSELAMPPALRLADGPDRRPRAAGATAELRGRPFGR
ncbi:MAG: hypothetical protein AAGD06_09535 [Acidobacteriota bacterium]